jgi:hypothetical protein
MGVRSVEEVDDAVVIHNSDRIALRLIPCDVLARVAPSAHQAGSEFEVEVARRLAGTSGPVAELEPRAEYRVYSRDGFAISFWTYYEPAGSEIAPAEYAGALMRLHAALRQADLGAPHFTDRVAGAQREVGDREQTPALTGPDRELLGNTLSRLSSSISRGGRWGAAVARRAASGQLAQYEERAALRRPRDVLPWAGRV